MRRERRAFFPIAAGLAAAFLLASPATAQKAGGTLQMPNFASPASMSLPEESTIVAGIAMMGVFNNLVVFDQHVGQDSLAPIVAPLPTGWTGREWRPALRLHF